ncbi:RNA-splicing factor [Kappamyces sp. JEL0829]|nr:RNA-splicing factor [Kappamyces sp. JEL0829]
MSYNGVGLQTARGSGTNGFVQRNLSYLKNKTVQRKDITNYSQAPAQAVKAANKDILDHEKKRAVEIKCLELEDKLLDEGLDEAAVEARVAKLRDELLSNLDATEKVEKKMKDWQTHQLAEAKERDNRRFGEALGIKSDYKHGSSFSLERQEERKQERLQELAKREKRFNDRQRQRSSNARPRDRQSPTRSRSIDRHRRDDSGTRNAGSRRHSSRRLLEPKLPDPAPQTAHKRYSSVYPCSSKLLAKKWDDATWKRHKEKISTMKACIDNVHSVEKPSTLRSLKKSIAKQENEKRIARENEILLERMARTFTKPSAFTNFEDAHSRTQKDLAHKAKAYMRKREQANEKIDIENEILLKRLQNKRASYEKKQWVTEGREHLRHLLNMTKFPEAYKSAAERARILKPRSATPQTLSGQKHPHDVEAPGSETALPTVTGEQKAEIAV